MDPKIYNRKARFLIIGAVIGILLSILFGEVTRYDFNGHERLYSTIPITIYFLLVSFSLLVSGVMLSKKKNFLPIFIFALVLMISSAFLTPEAAMDTEKARLTYNVFVSAFSFTLGFNIFVFLPAIFFWIGIFFNLFSIKKYREIFNVTRKQMIFYIFISIMISVLFWELLIIFAKNLN